MDVYDKEHVSIPSDASIFGEIPMTSMSSKKSLYSLVHTYNFLDNWIQCFDEDYQNRIAIYKSKMSELFETIPKSLPLKKVIIIKKIFRKKPGQLVGNGL